MPIVVIMKGTATMTKNNLPQTDWEARLPLLRCVDCGGGLQSRSEAALSCLDCGREFSIHDGMLDVMDRLAGNNKVAADFYNGPLWPKFRFWEHFTFFVNGGKRRCRMQVIGHLGELAGTRLLEVAIGDGSNVPYVPPDCELFGVDISAVQLRDCRRGYPDRDLDLVLGEAERLPFCDDTFDNVLSFGAFNYFNDPLGSLREMARVVKPEGLIVVSDEYPSLPNRMIGHWIGLPRLDRWIMSRCMRLGPEFTEMVQRHRNLKIEPIISEVLEDWRIHSLWMKVGYCVVGRAKKSPAPCSVTAAGREKATVTSSPEES